MERVCEVKYDHLQGDRFRHAAVFERWRPDKRPAGLPLRSARGHSSRGAGGDLRVMKLAAAVILRGAGVAGAGRPAMAAEWLQRREASCDSLLRGERAHAVGSVALLAASSTRASPTSSRTCARRLRTACAKAAIVYRVGADLPYSMTRGRTVSLMVERVRTDSAPYLHETVHVLVPSPNRSVWLSEGFASYVESYVSENIGGYDAHVFSKTGQPRGGHRGRALAGPRRRAHRAPVGGHARRAAGDARGEAARGRAVLRPVPVLLEVPGREARPRARHQPSSPRAIRKAAPRRLSGRSVEDWKADWLRTLPAGAV